MPRLLIELMCVLSILVQWPVMANRLRTSGGHIYFLVVVLSLPYRMYVISGEQELLETNEFHE